MAASPEDGAVEGVPFPGDPGDCPDVHPPDVLLDPYGGTHSTAALGVTVTWKDMHALQASTRSITLNGVNVTSTFSYVEKITYPGGGAEATSTGTLTLQVGTNAFSAAVCDTAGMCTTASVTYTYQPPPPPPVDPGYVGDPFSMERIERGMCVTVALGGGAAYECGDLRVVHGLPATRVLNRARAPTLLYNSQHARPQPIVAANFTPPAGAAPTTVVLTARVLNGTSWSAYPATHTWTGTTTRRIAVAIDATGLATGVYPYTLEATAHYADGTVRSFPQPAGRLVVVNRAASPYGSGWWVAGVEQLKFQGDTLALWIGGDGSARVYDRVPGTTNQWATRAFARPDVLTKITMQDENGAWVIGYERMLPGRVAVRYDDQGRHVVTRNQQGHESWFRYDGSSSRLARIGFPKLGAFDTGLGYTFQYANGGGTMLSRIVSPGPAGTRNTDVAIDGYGRVTRITDPDAHYVRYGYSTSTLPVLRTRHDRRGNHTIYYYDVGQRLHSVTTPVGTDTIKLRFLAAEACGLPTRCGARTLSTHHTWIDGPRTDVTDYTYLTLGRWGSPVKVVDALQNVTTIANDDPRWPALPTRVVAPGGFQTTATYDDRGNLETTTHWNPYGDGRNATTVYAWDSQWDAVTKVTLPEGEIVQTGYDAYGRRAWTQPGTDSIRRVRYAYVPLSSATAPGLVQSVTVPGGRTERFEYDARGNLEATVSPLGFRTTYRNDAVGRVVSVRTPTSSNAVVRVDSTVYDIVDQARQVISIGPAMNGIGEQRIIVDNDYDAEGNLLSVSRRSSPDPASIGAVVTRFQYDAAGRRVAEIAPDLKKDTVALDLAGNAIRVRTRRSAESATDPVSGEITMTYDALNRLLTRRTPLVRYPKRTNGLAGGSSLIDREPSYPSMDAEPDGSYVIPAQEESYAYDPRGNLLRARNPHAWVGRTYFPNGQLATDTLRIATIEGGDMSRHVYVLRHTYDRNGRRTELRHPSQLAPRVGGTVKDRTAYGYHPVTGVLSTVTDPMGNQFTYAYNYAGEQVGLTLPGGIAHTFGYDADGRATSHRIQDGTHPDGYHGAWLRDETLAYDARGKVTWYGNLVGNRDTATIKYSGLGHMVHSYQRFRGWTLQTDQAVLYQSTESPRYDALGNILTLSRSGDLNVYEDDIIDAGGRRLESTNSQSVYEAGTGRLLRRGLATAVDSTFYDRGGNIVFHTQQATTATAPDHDRASFYDAAGRLRTVEARRKEASGSKDSDFYLTFEEYRYDALGRRVWVMTRKDCDRPHDMRPCAVGSVTRTVWDGDRELYEIKAPVGNMENTLVNVYFSTDQMESDTSALPPQGRWDGFDPHPMYGRVAYTYGHGIDMPLSVIRMGYADHPAGSTYYAWQPFAIMPHWNLHGQAQTGTYASGAAVYKLNGRQVALDWPSGLFPYNPARPVPEHWHGSLLGDKRDASGLLYRRNRYYDPATARFTQEDPIGLAGGLNVYGFADGDPVNYSDPYGLYIVCRTRAACRLWNLAVRQAQDAAGSTDPVMREAGRTLLTRLDSLYRSDKPVYLTTRSNSAPRRALDWMFPNQLPVNYSGVCRHADRDCGSTPGYGIVIDPGWSKGKGVSALIRFSHEVGHVYAFMTGGSHPVESIIAEDAHRTIRNCSPRKYHDANSTPCR